MMKLIDGILVDTTELPRESEESDTPSEGEEEDEEEYSNVWKCPGANGSSCDNPGVDSRCVHSLYGNNQLTESEAKQRIGPNVEGGIVWFARILPDNYNEGGKLRLLQTKDYDAANSAPKPRRKMPFPLTASQFTSSLTRVGTPVVENTAEAGYDDLWDRDVRHNVKKLSITNDDPPRWVLTGVVNGWPGIRCLEVQKIETRETTGLLSRSLLSRTKGWTTSWSIKREGKEGKDPRCSKKDEKREVRVKLRAPEWTAHGWSKESPGFVMWVEGAKVGETNPPLKLTYGMNLVKHFKCNEEDDPLCTNVHMVSHRYALGKKAETQKDKLTYHSFVLLEWDHQQYCTVIEIGFNNGLGGYRCKSNWYHDKNETETQLYRAYPPEMIMPWKDTMSELRCHNVPYATMNAFKKGFLEKYEGQNERFVDLHYTFSHEVRLTYNSRRNIATYLLNYIRRDCTYNDMRKNCQTFAADFCGFLAGKKDVQPFHPINQIQYITQKHKFLYESSKYKTSTGRKR
eukprot:scaffold106900_cov50-Attheya_sp.AAC.6